MRNVLNILDLTTEEIDELISVAEDIAANPEKYQDKCKHKRLATLFFEPSTRTRLSFESAMLSLGGSVLGFAGAGLCSASNGESVYRIKADAFTLDGTAKVETTTEETTTLPFTAGVGVSAAAYEKTSGRYAVRSGNTLILIGADGKVYKTVTGAVGDKMCGVVCDEHYIYLMYENKGGIAFNVFDWKGNKVCAFKQDGLISETTEANIPSMWIENGKVYIFAKPWGSTSMYVYVVDLASLNFLPTV